MSGLALGLAIGFATTGGFAGMFFGMFDGFSLFGGSSTPKRSMTSHILTGIFAGAVLGGGIGYAVDGGISSTYDGIKNFFNNQGEPSFSEQCTNSAPAGSTVSVTKDADGKLKCEIQMPQNAPTAAKPKVG